VLACFPLAASSPAGFLFGRLRPAAPSRRVAIVHHGMRAACSYRFRCCRFSCSFFIARHGSLRRLFHRHRRHGVFCFCQDATPQSSPLPPCWLIFMLQFFAAMPAANYCPLAPRAGARRCRFFVVALMLFIITIYCRRHFPCLFTFHSSRFVVSSHVAAICFHCPSAPSRQQHPPFCCAPVYRLFDQFFLHVDYSVSVFQFPVQRFPAASPLPPGSVALHGGADFISVDRLFFSSFTTTTSARRHGDRFCFSWRQLLILSPVVYASCRFSASPATNFVTMNRACCHVRRPYFI